MILKGETTALGKESAVSSTRNPARNGLVLNPVLRAQQWHGLMRTSGGLLFMASNLPIRGKIHSEMDWLLRGVS